jgi:hypothetical protein
LNIPNAQLDRALQFQWNTGFLTTPELFYVRNHGAVPDVPDEHVLKWELSIEGQA